MQRMLRTIGLYLVMGLMVIMIVNNLYGQVERPEEMTFSEFTTHWNNRDVAELTIIGEHTVEGKLRNGKEFTLYHPDVSGLIEEIRTNPELSRTVKVNAEPPPPTPWWVGMLPNLLSVILLIGVWFFLLNQIQGGGNRAMSFGKSRARLHLDDRGKVTFEDVAGVDEAKEELAEIVEFLKHPKKFSELGARVPKGVLLVGPPGTGKTLLGRAVAGEADVPFFSISGSDFVEMFVGVGAARVRDLFEQAKRNAPCIVFIDEIDAVGRQRGAGLGGGHDEREQTLNQLLVEMDGFEPNVGIIILAATNRPDVLDPALLRPGRFDRQVVVDIPDQQGRLAILKIHARNKPLAPEVDLKVLARRTPGFTGADLENLLNEAALLAARNGKKRISMEDCEEAIDRVIAGPAKKGRMISEKERNLVAYHEAGHALVGKLLPNADPVHKVSIIPRGRTGGFTLSLPEEDKRYMTKSEMLDEITELLGGRVAEEIALGEISTGAQNDIERATRIARKMVTEYGMSEKLGPLTFGKAHEDLVFLGRDIARDRNYSEEVAAEIDAEVRRIVESCHAKARELLTNHRDALDRIVERLKEKETLEGQELEELLNATVGGERSETVKVEGLTEPRTGEAAKARAEASVDGVAPGPEAGPWDGPGAAGLEDPKTNARTSAAPRAEAPRAEVPRADGSPEHKPIEPARGNTEPYEPAAMKDVGKRS